MKQIINKIKEIFKLNPTCSEVHVDRPGGLCIREQKVKKIEDDYASILAKMQEIIDKRSKNIENESKDSKKETEPEKEIISEPFRGETF